MIIKALPFLRKEDAPTFGAKAANLGELTYWFPTVPSGYAIRFEGSLDDHGLTWITHSLFTPLGKVAVRSSGLGEDGETTSFAGQHETILNCEGDLEILEAIHKCRQSVHSPEAVAYRHEHGITETPQIAVVVQKMVDAKCAGVAFTRHPMTGEECVVIEATPGLGDKLVSGHITPDCYIWRERGPHEQTLTGKIPVLRPEDVFRIAALSRMTQGLFGDVPLDIEWAIDMDGNVCPLQARPITTLKMSI